jgi:ABC-type bacteriocin/lantibiotic exporter with double-glycine peptidase domain
MRTAAARFLAPEVIQTSAMDCGPAALKCLFQGFGIQISYGRLREACQTDVDGTSINALEDVAVAIGLDAEQVMLPPDHLFVAPAEVWPALVVVRQPNGNTHFVVVWRRYGPWLQVMDPAVGRRWVTQRELLTELYGHVMAVDAETYCSWATSSECLAVLRARLEGMGVERDEIDQRIAAAMRVSSWEALAQLDAATRMINALFVARALRSQVEVLDALQTLVTGPATAIPDAYWTVSPKQESNGAQVWFSGAVLLRVRGRGSAAVSAQIPVDLRRVICEPKITPYRTIMNLLVDGARTGSVVLAFIVALLTAGLVLEGLLLRALLSIDDALVLTEQRLGLLVVVAIFASALLAMEFLIAQGAWRLGRRLEVRLRIALLRKIPRLHDDYFQSRLSSDMAERNHSTHLLRGLPELVAEALRALMLIVLTASGIVWLDPASALPAILLLFGVVALPVAAQPIFAERELRVRTHAGGLARHYLDALLGLVPARAHSAERTLARQYETRVTQWGRAALALGRTTVWVDGVASMCGLLLAANLLHAHMGRAGELSAVLLLAYWTLQLPPLGQKLVMLTQQLATLRNVTTRLIEPLGSPEEALSPQTLACGSTTDSAMAITLNGVGVRVGGHIVLEDCNLAAAPGEHIAIVGASGAGKSTLVGLLLGWYRPAVGSIHVNGGLLTADTLAQLRQHTAWVDPAVQLWNSTFLSNLCYGLSSKDEVDIPVLMAKSALQDVLARLPEGLQTLLGEGGAFISGGEGQRLRLARALARHDVRLAVLDEPFRGLDREHRRRLLAAVREHWRDVSLFCVTHDLAETQDFPRVLVIEHGRIVEDGTPQALYARTDSRYRALVEADEQVRQRTWQDDMWRRLSLIDGRLQEKFHRASQVVSLKGRRDV